LALRLLGLAAVLPGEVAAFCALAIDMPASSAAAVNVARVFIIRFLLGDER
jgi:hypothetical protein